MYKLEPVFVLPEKINLPACMYKLPPVRVTPDKHNTTTVSNSGCISSAKYLKKGKEEETLQELEQLQQSVLEKLRLFHQQMTAVSNELGVDGSALAQCKEPVSGSLNEDIVISAHYFCPPWFLLFFKKWLCDRGVSMKSTCFVHSSVRDGSKCPANFINGHSEGNNGQLNLALIWTDGAKNVSMSVSPLTQVIVGAENVARYISRLLPAPYNYELQNDGVLVTETDMWLDLSASMMSSSKEQAAAVKAIAKRLSQNPWLGGTNPSIADAVVWSNLNVTQDQNFPPAVQQWMKACAEYVA